MPLGGLVPESLRRRPAVGWRPTVGFLSWEGTQRPWPLWVGAPQVCSSWEGAQEPWEGTRGPWVVGWPPTTLFLFIVSMAGIGPAPLAKAAGASGGCRSGLKTWAGGASRDLARAFQRPVPRAPAIRMGAKDGTESLEVHTLQAVWGKLCGNPGRPTQ